jgi:hypothetical protein
MLINLDTSFYLNNIYNPSIKSKPINNDKIKQENGNDLINTNNVNFINGNDKINIKDNKNPLSFKDNLCKSLVEKLIEQHMNHEHRLSAKNSLKMRHLANDTTNYEKFAKYARRKALRKILRNKSIEFPLISTSIVLNIGKKNNQHSSPSLKLSPNDKNIDKKNQHNKPFSLSNLNNVDHKITPKQTKLSNLQSDIYTNLDFYKKCSDLNTQFNRHLTNNMILPVNFNLNHSPFSSSNLFRINSFI